MFKSEWIASQQASVDAVFGVGKRMFDSVEAAVELNLEVARDGLGEAAEMATGALSLGDAQERLVFGGLGPAFERVTGYGRRWHEIAAGTQVDLTRLAGDVASTAQNQWLAWVRQQTAH